MDTMKGKLFLVIAMFAVMLAACGNDTTKSEKASASSKKAEATTKKVQEESDSIKTTAFVYAKKVKITDARDITKHIDVVVYRTADVKPGLATQQVLTQSYKFLQQDDIKGAETVTVGVMCGDLRVSQFTINVKKFKAGDNFIQSVLKASKIDKMNGDVKEYGKTMNLW